MLDLMKINSLLKKANRLKIQNASHSERFLTFGFTLMELLVTVSIAVVLLATAVNSLFSLTSAFKRLDSKSQLTFDLRKAQAISVQEGCRGLFLIAPDNLSYSFGCDYLPYSTATPPEMDTTEFVRNFEPRFSISSDSYMIFNSKGQSIDTMGALDTRVFSFMEDEQSDGVLTTYAQGTVYATGTFSFSDLSGY